MSKFQELVQNLDQDGLEELRRSLAMEAEERRQKTAIRIEHIHAGMTADEKEAVAKEIQRVLRGED